MLFHVGVPVYDTANKSQVLVIHDGPAIFKGTVAPRFEPDFKANNDEFMSFVSEFLKQASPYFSKPLDQNVFLQRIHHTYSTGEDISGENIISINWIPARVLFYPNRYEVQWIVGEIQEVQSIPAHPGTEIIETDIPISEKPYSQQKRIRQKVRQARLKCAVARLYLERITEKYYAKYGNFDGFSDSDSELSSEEEDLRK